MKYLLHELVFARYKVHKSRKAYEVPLAEKTFYYSIEAGAWAAGRTLEPWASFWDMGIWERGTSKKII